MFSITNPFAFVVVFAAAALIASLLARSTRYFRKLVASSQTRLAPLDGLRGFLALGVFVHHSVCNYQYLTTGAWALPPSVIYIYLGGGCVSLFFMTSAFLFWSRTLDGPVVPAQLFISRFFRIMPLYWAAMIVVWLSVWSALKWQYAGTSVALVRESVLWLFGGFFSVWTYAGVPTCNYNAGVTWTLLYEWWFYLSLPLLSVFATNWRFAIGFVLFFILRSKCQLYFPEFYTGFLYASGFALGMLAAHLVRIEWLRRLLRGRLAALWALAHLSGLLWYNHTHPTDPFTWEVVSFPLFLVTVCGNSIFSILRRRWTLFLGHISYSVYLTHGIVLYFVVQLALGPKEVIRMGATQYWGFIAFVVGPLVVLSSTLTYRFIEAPFLSLASLRHKRPRKKDAAASETVVGPTLVAEA